MKNDHMIAKEADFEGIYKWQLAERSIDKVFILHDGPPYANGRLHLGHAVNKITKDCIVRYKCMRGHRVEYRPGWDCHGLPIELKAITSKLSGLEPVEIREKSRKFAKEAVGEQMKGFKSWGLLADWSTNGTYRTFDPEYMKLEMRTFYELFEKGLIYQDYKPVYWSPSSRTSLAEAELEYNSNHSSTSVYVRFLASDLPNDLEALVQEERVYFPVWTTTPWTLPSNVGIAFNPAFEYAIIKAQTERDTAVYIVAKELLNQFTQSVGSISTSIILTIPGSRLKEIEYIHPIYNKKLPLVGSDHVTTEKGTGLVHTAPAHGPEDFEVARKYNLPVLDLVDECGKFRVDAGNQLDNKDIFTDGQDAVLELLGESIMKIEKFVHSYPYDWRTKLPVIYRASLQWFIDVEKIRSSALKTLDEVDLKPKSLGHDLRWEVSKRPPWCISRQRSWGVPIPVLYKDGKPLVNKEIVERACQLIDEKGPDSWWNCSVSDLVDKDPELYEKKTEILDIWLDSGLSWLNVLGRDKQADLYVEGLDQCRGWFQSSLLTSIALRGVAPYRSVLAHGFVLDEDGRKMSKSLGNVIDPEEILQGKKKDPKSAHGIDVLRWWCLGHRNLADPIRASESIFANSSEEVQIIRKTFRFLLGSLNDTDKSHLLSIPVSDLHLIDRYMLFILAEFTSNALDAYENYDSRRVYSNLLQFVARDVSSFYFWILKDRLYCEAKDSPNRLSALVVLYNLFIYLGLVTTPILPHLTKEVHMHTPKSLGVNDFQKSLIADLPSDWLDLSVKAKVAPVLQIRDEVNASLTGMNTVQLALDLTGREFTDKIQEDFYHDARSGEDQLAELFKVSEVTFENSRTDPVFNKDLNLEQNEVSVTAAKSANSRCPRCRLYVSLSSNSLCSRCSNVIKDLNK
ncbi:isoleucine--tRNA ligase, mitochondrial-like isoform X1 [Artemia franciscana]